MSARFSIEPRGAFSLAEASRLAFGSREPDADATMRLAFAADGDGSATGVVLRQGVGGAVVGERQGAADIDAVRTQVARILSLDGDGTAWAAVVAGDPVLARLDAERPGLRPVLFHSPYEAAAWSIISARQARSQALRSRTRIAERLGTTFDLAGEPLAAFPAPAILGADEVPELPAVKGARLRAVATAALAGDLDADRLRALPPAEAYAELQRLPGIGPFYAMLVVVRATGASDVLPADEPRVRAAVGHWYGLGGAATQAQLEEIAEGWRPFRTWASVLLRSAADRAGVTGRTVSPPASG